MSINGIKSDNNKITEAGIDRKIKSDTTKNKPNHSPANAREAFEFPPGITLTGTQCYHPSLKKWPPELLFDVQYNSATRLSDGSRLLRPVCLSLGKVDIEPSTVRKEYKVTITPYSDHDGSKTISKIMTENELLTNRTLARGIIKKAYGDDNKYIIRFADKTGEYHEITADKKECLQHLRENFLYM